MRLAPRSKSSAPVVYSEKSRPVAAPMHSSACCSGAAISLKMRSPVSFIWFGDLLGDFFGAEAGTSRSDASASKGVGCPCGWG